MVDDRMRGGGGGDRGVDSTVWCSLSADSSPGSSGVRLLAHVLTTQVDGSRNIKPRPIAFDTDSFRAGPVILGRRRGVEVAQSMVEADRHQSAIGKNAPVKTCHMH